MLRFARKVPLLKGLSDNELIQVAKRMPERTYGSVTGLELGAWGGRGGGGRGLFRLLAPSNEAMEPKGPKAAARRAIAQLALDGGLMVAAHAVHAAHAAHAAHDELLMPPSAAQRHAGRGRR
jgi:hypothetical protein